MAFVNRKRELAALDDWDKQPGPRFGVVWGRRRVGKSLLLSHWAKGRRAVLHVARNRAMPEELAALSRTAAPVVSLPHRDLVERPFRDWDEAFEIFAAAAQSEPLVVVVDEFPDLVTADPRIESTLRAIWERIGEAKLRLILCGSSVRTMEALQEERAPLYGRATLRLQVRPFAPHEAAKMLPGLPPAERARAWGICGGMPFYLALWDQDAGYVDNVARLFGGEHGILLDEGELVLATEDFAGGRRERVPEQVLRAIAAGRTRFGEIKDALGADPTRALAALQGLDLIERVLPVGRNADPRRAYYRITDNFLAFWLSVVEPHRPAVVRGLGRSVSASMATRSEGLLGERWEDAFRAHLVRTLVGDPRFEPIAELGRFWKQYGADPCEIDAVVLTGQSGRLTLAGEAKWSRSEDGGRVIRGLRRKVAASDLLGRDDPDPVYAVCAREAVTGELPPETLVITAEEIFA